MILGKGEGSKLKTAHAEKGSTECPPAIMRNYLTIEAIALEGGG